MKRTGREKHARESVSGPVIAGAALTGLLGTGLLGFAITHLLSPGDDEEYQHKREEGQQSRFPVVGLPNTGNTCFWNALLQFMACLPWLRYSLVDIVSSDVTNREFYEELLYVLNRLASGTPVSRGRYQNLQRLLHEDSPRGVKEEMQEGPGRQQDGTSILLLIMEQILAIEWWKDQLPYTALDTNPRHHNIRVPVILVTTENEVAAELQDRMENGTYIDFSDYILIRIASNVVFREMLNIEGKSYSLIATLERRGGGNISYAQDIRSVSLRSAGHFVANVKRNGTWYFTSDSHVRISNFQDVSQKGQTVFLAYKRNNVT